MALTKRTRRKQPGGLRRGRFPRPMPGARTVSVPGVATGMDTIKEKVNSGELTMTEGTLDPKVTNSGDDSDSLTGTDLSTFTGTTPSDTSSDRSATETDEGETFVEVEVLSSDLDVALFDLMSEFIKEVVQETLNNLESKENKSPAKKPKLQVVTPKEPRNARIHRILKENANTRTVKAARAIMEETKPEPSINQTLKELYREGRENTKIEEKETKLEIKHKGKSGKTLQRLREIHNISPNSSFEGSVTDSGMAREKHTAMKHTGKPAVKKKKPHPAAPAAPAGPAPKPGMSGYKAGPRGRPKPASPGSAAKIAKNGAIILGRVRKRDPNVNLIHPPAKARNEEETRTWYARTE